MAGEIQAKSENDQKEQKANTLRDMEENKMN